MRENAEAGSEVAPFRHHPCTGRDLGGPRRVPVWLPPSGAARSPARHAVTVRTPALVPAPVRPGRVNPAGLRCAVSASGRATRSGRSRSSPRRCSRRRPSPARASRRIRSGRRCRPRSGALDGGAGADGRHRSGAAREDPRRAVRLEREAHDRRERGRRARERRRRADLRPARRLVYVPRWDMARVSEHGPGRAAVRRQRALLHGMRRGGRLHVLLPGRRLGPVPGRGALGVHRHGVHLRVSEAIHSPRFGREGNVNSGRGSRVNRLRQSPPCKRLRPRTWSRAMTYVCAWESSSSGITTRW